MQRARITIRLSTLVALAFACGFIMMLNLVPNCKLRKGNTETGISDLWRTHHYGWPLVACTAIEDTGISAIFWSNGDIDPLTALPAPRREFIDVEWNTQNILMNFVVVTLLLGQVGYLCELLTRRRQSKIQNLKSKIESAP